MRQVNLRVLGVAALAMGITTTHAQTPAASAMTAATADPTDVRADAILARMSLERKVAQLIQPDISSITPDDVRKYRFGSILNGGNSGPGGNDKAPAPAWLALADSFWAASTAPQDDGQPAIPTLWATDAVHGHNNIAGATLFPHNIALGAANDPALMRRIGEATAAEIATTGIDWAFAPTIAVSRDTRWGRSYESFSEDPALVARLAVPMAEGLQGKPGTAAFLDQAHGIATIKHFFADGGTGGIDRGDTRGGMADILRIHAAPYRPAIAAGAQSVMASFSSINGEKMHGNKALLTGLLRDDMHFDGVVVGDWNGHATVPGCSNADCPRALMAGLDIFMVPEDWKGLYETTLREARDGTIPLARIDEAVRRVLRLKLRYGLFDKPRPAMRVLAGQWALLGSAEHRAAAREAVAKSLVLLKNNGVLPIRASAHILVAGKAADSVPMQSGGWSISWQGGGDLTNADFPGATSIYAGIALAARAGGGTAVLSPDGSFARRPDVAVVVFGEQPYAEFAGDRPDHALHDEEGLNLLRKFHAAHIPTVAVLLSGRPLWVGREIAEADGFVAAWLPGSEGEGLVDVLVGGAKGRPARDFTGRLPFHWPADCNDSAAPLLPLGAGGDYAHAPKLPPLTLSCAGSDSAGAGGTTLFQRALGLGVTAFAHSDRGAEVMLPGFTGATSDSAVSVTSFDAKAQEDGRKITWSAPGEVTLRLDPTVDAAGQTLEMDYATDPAHAGAVHIDLEAGAHGVPAVLPPAPDQTGGHLALPLRCLGGPRIAALRFRAEVATFLRVTSLTTRPARAGEPCPAPPPGTP